MSDTVKKSTKKAAKKGTKGGKKVVRGLKEARAKLTPEKRAQLEEFDELGKVDNVDTWQEETAVTATSAPGKVAEPVEYVVPTDPRALPWLEFKRPDFAERVANAALVSWRRFVRKLPRLVWVDDRIMVNIRLTDEGQVGVFFHSKFNPKAV